MFGGGFYGGMPGGEMMDPMMEPMAGGGAQDQLVERSKRVLGGVIEAIGDSDAGVRRGAARLIGQLGRHDSKPAAEALLTALKDPDVQVRRVVAGALSQLAAVQGAIPVEALAKATTDADADVRLASLGALAAMGSAAPSRGGDTPNRSNSRAPSCSLASSASWMPLASTRMMA